MGQGTSKCNPDRYMLAWWGTGHPQMKWRILKKLNRSDHQ